MAFPKTKIELADILKACAKLNCKCAILGAGTNVLAPDEGVRGLVVLPEGLPWRHGTAGRDPHPGDGGRDHGTGGGERCEHGSHRHGIRPRHTGNRRRRRVYERRAYGGEICQICESVEVMDLDGKLFRLSNTEMAFSYRHSVLENRTGIVVSADFALKKGNPEEIWAKMKELIARRTASQPLDVPSAGSAFKRPTGGYAAALIEEAGLKGYQVGGAAISAKHAGFAVNLGGATAADVKALLSQVSEQVYQKSGIRLEPEVRIW